MQAPFYGRARFSCPVGTLFRARGCGGKCRRQLGSDPDGLGEPYPEKPAGMSAARYTYLLDRLDAAEDDMDLPLNLGGPRFAHRPDRHRLRGRP